MTTLWRFPIRIVGEEHAPVDRVASRRRGVPGTGTPRMRPGPGLQTGCAIELPLGLSEEAARELAREVARVLARYAEQHTSEAYVQVYLGRASVVQRGDVQEGRG